MRRRGVRGLAALHQRRFLDLAGSDAAVEIELLFPAPRTATGGLARDKALGTPRTETETDPAKTRRLRVLWSNDYVRPDAVLGGDIAEAVATMADGGKRLDAVLRVRLAEVLLDPASPQGDTLFDQVKYVRYQKQNFEVVDTKRSGLPPLGPYILWVALRRAGQKPA